MFSKVLVVGLVLTISIYVSAQEPIIEYGQASELKGVTIIFVDTGTDIQQRNLIAKELQKQLPNVAIASRPEETDIHLRFFLTQTGAGKTDWVGTVVKLMGSNRVRLLFSYKDQTPPLFEQDKFMSSAMELAKPHMFVRQFVKVYRVVNDGNKV
jgi:hypothetical protein